MICKICYEDDYGFYTFGRRSKEPVMQRKGKWEHVAVDANEYAHPLEDVVPMENQES